MRSIHREAHGGPWSASRMAHICVVLGAFLVHALLPQAVAAQSLQAQGWYEVQTPNFRVHGHASVAPLLPEIASMAEQAHELLVPLLGAPQGRTSIVVSDPFDSANGSASVVPRRVIQVFAYPPETMSTLGFHDNWMWNLIVHEYTHILHMDSMGRVFSWANFPFGRRWAPNQALPRWLIEGLATWQESTQSGTGRVRSNLFRMQMRAASIAGSEPNLGSIAGFPGDWPNAGLWYLVGGFFVDAIARWHGEASWGRFVEVYGRRAIPYGINATAIEVFGEDVPTMYARFLAAERVSAAAFVASRALEPITESSPLTHSGFRTMDSSWDQASETLVWIEAGGDRPRELRWKSPRGEGRLPAFDGDDVVVLPGGTAVIVTEEFGLAQGVSRRDLVEVDLETGHRQRLTYGARASEPAISPDGRSVAFVAAADGRSDLWLFDRGSRVSRVLSRADDWSLFGTPAFASDATIVASLHRPSMGRDLVTVDIDSGAYSVVVGGVGEAIAPAHVAGTSFVVFADDRDGVYSLYAVSLESGEIFRVSRPLTGHFAPTIGAVVSDNLTIHAAEYSERGYDIVSMVVPWPPRGPVGVAGVDGRRAAPSIATSVDHSLRRHRDGRAFVPYRWFPAFSAANGDSLAGVSLAAADVTGRHDYTALLNWSFGARTPVYAVYAQTSVLPLRLRANASRVVVERAESLRAGSVFVPFDEVQWSAGLGTDAVFDAGEGAHVVSLDWTLFRSAYLRTPRLVHRPEDLEPRYPLFPRLDSIALGWSWSSLRSSARAVSPQSGFSASIGARFRGPFTGAEVDSAELGASLRGYVTMPWHDHHSIALRASGGVSRARRIGRRLYAIGGPDPQDVLQAMVDSLPSGTAHVRGFAPQARVGDRFALVTGEYRLALFRWHAGYATLPLVFERLSLAVFADAGYAGSNVARWRDMIGGFGAELRLETTISYFQGASLRLGLARGVGRGAITDVYLLYGWWF